MTNAAAWLSLGGDPVVFLTADGDDRLVLRAVLAKAWKLREDRLRYLAVQIANNLGRAMGGR